MFMLCSFHCILWPPLGLYIIIPVYCNSFPMALQSVWFNFYFLTALVCLWCIINLIHPQLTSAASSLAVCPLLWVCVCGLMYACMCCVLLRSAVKDRCRATAPGCWAEREKQEDAVGHSGSGPGVRVSLPGVAFPNPDPYLHTHPFGGQLRGGSGRAMLRAVHLRSQGRRAACALWWAGLHQCQPGISPPPLFSRTRGAAQHFIAI